MLEKFEEVVDGEITLIDILLFIKNSLNDISKSVAFTFLVGIGYYFNTPDIYQATVNIQMAIVAGNAVESPTNLLEKIKLPLYFSRETWSACDASEDKAPFTKMTDIIKPTLNKSAPFLAFTVQAKSIREAKKCLIAVIEDIQAKQAEMAKPILEQKMLRIQQLNEKLKLSEEASKFFPESRPLESFPDSQFASRALVLSTSISTAREIRNLRNEINDVEISLTEPQTKPTSLPVPMYASEVAINKRPMLILLICLTLGLLMGFAITGIKKLMPVIGKQLNNAQPINSQS